MKSATTWWPVDEVSDKAKAGHGVPHLRRLSQDVEYHRHRCLGHPLHLPFQLGRLKFDFSHQGRWLTRMLLVDSRQCAGVHTSLSLPHVGREAPCATPRLTSVTNASCQHVIALAQNSEGRESPFVGTAKEISMVSTEGKSRGGRSLRFRSQLQSRASEFACRGAHEELHHIIETRQNGVVV